MNTMPSTMLNTTRVGLVLSAAIFALSAPVILQKVWPPEKPARMDRLDRLSYALPSPFAFHEAVEAICGDEPECLQSARAAGTAYSLAKLALSETRAARHNNPERADFDYDSARAVVKHAGSVWAGFVKEYAK